MSSENLRHSCGTPVKRVRADTKKGHIEVYARVPFAPLSTLSPWQNGVLPSILPLFDKLVQPLERCFRLFHFPCSGCAAGQCFQNRARLGSGDLFQHFDRSQNVDLLGGQRFTRKIVQQFTSS
jgi:hypothetical protein